MFKVWKFGHSPIKCRHSGAKCHNYGKTGHLKAVCRSKQKPRHVRTLEHVPNEEYPESHSLFQLTGSGTNARSPLEVSVLADGHKLLMEVDTGASCSLISEKTFKQHWVNHKVQETTFNLRNYSRENPHVIRKLTVQVIYKTEEADLPLVVVRRAGPKLLGRDWMVTSNWIGSPFIILKALSIQFCIGIRPYFRAALGPSKTTKPRYTLILRQPQSTARPIQCHMP